MKAREAAVRALLACEKRGAWSDAYLNGLFEKESPDRREALVNLVGSHVRANAAFPYIRLKGLDPDRMYRAEETGEIASGAALMYGGYTYFPLNGDYPAVQMHWVSEK